MNRPAARNALSGPMMAQMREAWDRVDADPGIRACVLTGAGGAFCAGADLKAVTGSHPGDQFAAGDTAFAVEARIGMAVFRSQDAKEGPRAFAQKRTSDQ